MRNLLLYLTFVLLVVSCSPEKRKKVRIPQPKEASQVDTQENEEVSFDTSSIDLSSLTDSTTLEAFVHAYEAQFEVGKQEPTGVLSRFRTDKKSQYALTAKFNVLRDDSTSFRPSFTLQHFDFGDTTRMQNAILNITACFGKNCDEIEWSKDTSGLDVLPSLYIINETSFYTLHHQCEDFNWDKIYSELISIFQGSNAVILRTNCDGSLYWN